jgi:hypothetical protein
MNKSKIVETDLSSLNTNIRELITNYDKMETELLEARTIIEHYKQEIKLKDSQIAAFERSAANKHKNTTNQQSPNATQELTPPTIDRPKTPGPSYIVVVKETNSEKTVEYKLPDNYIIFELDGEKYYRNMETDELYKYMPIGDISDLYFLGKLKLFKIKNGKQYITNTVNHKVYNYSDDDEIMDYCGDILNGKFKLH